jgi:hypothetical protein
MDRGKGRKEKKIEKGKRKRKEKKIYNRGPAYENKKRWKGS